MTNSAKKFTAKVLEAYSHIENPRLNVLLQTLIKHLHGFIEETKLQETEWEMAWQFLAKMAAFTHDKRNEFLLMADVLGVSQLIELMNSHRPQETVGSALLGPFYRANAPLRKRGECIGSEDTKGPRLVIRGKVLDMQQNPISHAVLDVWQAAENGLYETQDPHQSDMNLRGKFTTDENGTYELVAIMPTPYPVPIDGPTGQLLEIAKRHPFRPAHIHFIVSSPAFNTLVTQVFVAGDEKIQSDVVFTASENMIGNFSKQDDTFFLDYDFQLMPGKMSYPKSPIEE